jgi:hypothetical protein
MPTAAPQLAFSIEGLADDPLITTLTALAKDEPPEPDD